MKVPANKFAILLSAALLLAATVYTIWPTTAHINPTLPQPGLRSAPVRENSTVLIPIEVGFSELGALVEKHFPDGQLLHSGHHQESPSLSYRYTVRRWGASSFEIKNGAIQLSLPLRIDATGRKDICLGIKIKEKCKGIKTSESGDSTAYVDAKAVIAVIVTEDYRVEVGTNVTQTLANRPHLNMDLFGNAIRIKINIEDEVEKLLKKQEAKVTAALDHLLASELQNLDLKAALQQHWRTIRTPIKAGPAWISLDPKALLFKGIHQLSEGRVALGFGFTGPTSLSLTKPEAAAANVLPPVTPAFTLATEENGFSLRVPLSSAFAELNTTAQEHLVGRTFRKNEHWIQINDITLSGAALENAQGENRATLIAIVSFNAGKGAQSEDNMLADGTLLISFMPSVNREKRTLEIVDVAATSDTLSLMEAAGVSWLNSKFTPEILAELSYDYGAQIDKWQPQLNAALGGGVPFKGFTLSGMLETLDIGGFYISGDKLEVYLEARGTVQAVLDKLPL